MENQQKQRLSQISRDEVDIVNDIRELGFGRINIVIQDGVVISKEITKVIKRSKNRNNKILGSENDNEYSGEEGMC